MHMFFIFLCFSPASIYIVQMSTCVQNTCTKYPPSLYSVPPATETQDIFAVFLTNTTGKQHTRTHIFICVDMLEKNAITQIPIYMPTPFPTAHTKPLYTRKSNTCPKAYCEYTNSMFSLSCNHHRWFAGCWVGAARGEWTCDWGRVSGASVTYLQHDISSTCTGNCAPAQHEHLFGHRLSEQSNFALHSAGILHQR